VRINAFQIAKNVQMQRRGLKRFWAALVQAFQMAFGSRQFSGPKLGLFRYLTQSGHPGMARKQGFA
jgi:hypothetical protein